MESFLYDYLEIAIWGILFLLIYAVYRMNFLMKKYADVQRQFTGEQFQRIVEASDEATELILAHSKKLNSDIKNDFLKTLKEIQGMVNLIGVKMESSFETINRESLKAFNSIEHTNTTAKNQMDRFIAELKRSFDQQYVYFKDTNQKLQKTLESIEETNKGSKKLAEVGQKNNEKLEQVSDKTKELVSRHEITIDKYLSSFEQGVNSMNSNYKENIDQLNAQTEIKVSEFTSVFMDQIEKSTQTLSEEIVKIREHSLKAIEEITEKNKSQIRDLVEGNKLLGLFNQNAQLLDQLKILTEESKKDTQATFEKFDQKIKELDEVIQTNSKKRGFFG